MQDRSHAHARPAAADDRRYVAALARGLQVLRCFAPHERWLGNVEIARRTGLPKATVSRLAWTLAALGYLEYAPDRAKYALGAGVLTLGFTLLSDAEIARLARPWMQELAERCGASVSLGVRSQLEMVYIENCRSAAPLLLGIGVGERLPIGPTSMGRAWLCGVDERTRSQVLDQLRHAHPHDWPRLCAGIERALHEHADHGFVASIGEWEPDINAVGCPLVLADGATVLALSVGGPASRLSPDRLADEIGPQLAAVARAVRAAVEEPAPRRWGLPGHAGA